MYVSVKIVRWLRQTCLAIRSQLHRGPATLWNNVEYVTTAWSRIFAFPYGRVIHSRSPGCCVHDRFLRYVACFSWVSCESHATNHVDGVSVCSCTQTIINATTLNVPSENGAAR